MAIDAPVGDFAPDQPDFEKTGVSKATNVIPAAKSFKPFPAFAIVSSSALTARAQGGFFARKSDGTGLLISGDATKLYQLVSGVWSDISRLVGGDYACPSDGVWTFVQFGTVVYAFNGVDAPQQFNIDSDTNFSAMTGSPPTAKRAAAVGDFIVTGSQAGARNRLQWGPIDNNGSWTPSQVTQADSQDLPDGGEIQGIVGYDLAGVVIQEFAIRRMAYVGTPLVFQIAVVANNVGCSIPGSIAAYRDLIFFCDRSGFWMLQGGFQLTPIGDQRVNNYFWSQVDQGNLPRVCSGIDAVNNGYAIFFPDASATGGAPNRGLFYSFNTNQWSEIGPDSAMELVFAGATQQAWTIEQLDIFGTIENVPYPFDSTVWTGVMRRVLSGFNTSHQLGYFSGAALAATVDTTEVNLTPGKFSRVQSVRPLLVGGSASVALGTRNRQTDVPMFGAASAMNGNGICCFNQSSRYVRGRITIAAGESWTDLLGLDDIQFAPEGDQ